MHLCKPFQALLLPLRIFLLFWSFVLSRRRICFRGVVGGEVGVGLAKFVCVQVPIWGLRVPHLGKALGENDTMNQSLHGVLP